MISHLRILPLELSEANALVKELHRHHQRQDDDGAEGDDGV